MPVGTGVENSAMKTSFSLSSLQQHRDMSNSVTAEKSKTDVAYVVTPRQCQTLTKRIRGAGEGSETLCRRSWGSTASDQNKEFWKALEKNYNFIMDNQLIENCQAANFELSDTLNWTLTEFYSQFSELYSWLSKVQDDITDHQGRDNSDELQAKHQNNLNRNGGALKLFNQQAQQLRKHATAQDLEQIDWRIAHLNSKWESVEAAIKPSEADKCELETDIDSEIDCLSKWLNTMEASIPEVDLWVKWSKSEVEAKRIEHKSLHQDIENHGRIVRSAVRRCEQEQQHQGTLQRTPGTAAGDADELDGTSDADAAVQRLDAVTDLEQRWYELCLRSHEWQCFIESLAAREPQLAIQDYESNEEMNPHEAESKSMSTNTEPEPTLSLFANENPKFNRSERKAQNLGTFYFKHVDTEDSDLEKNLPTENDEPADNMSSASDNELTYQALNPTEHAQQTMDDTATTTDDDENVQRLVSQAEDLLTTNVADTSNSVSNKLRRVKMWLERGVTKNDTSCDASAEEDEDQDVGESDDSKEPCGLVSLADDSSEELNESIATTCRQIGQSIPATIGSQNISLDDLGLAEQHAVPSSTSKVIMRNKGAGSRTRPLSDFCVSQLSNRICDSTEGFSISETALNQLPLNIKKLNATNSMHCVDADKPLNNNSTSSTVEDTTGALPMEDKAGGTRRKRLKSKKKSILRKSGEISSGSGLVRPLIRKSGSFSGRGACGTTNSSPVSGTDRHAVSDPSALHRSYGTSARVAHADTTSTTSDVDSDEEKPVQRAPIFRLDLKTNYRQNINNNSGLMQPASNSQKNSLNNGEEQFSSVSEQAWDSFQEKYSSEAYSEAQDSDGARRLLEFGEDYRNFLDSQSDWSCQSAAQHPHLQQRNSKQAFSAQQIAAAIANNNILPLERRTNTLGKSQSELRLIETVIDRCMAGGPAKIREISPLIHGELIERCDTNLSQLKRMRRNSSRRSSTSTRRSVDDEQPSSALDDTIVATDEAVTAEEADDTPLSKAELMASWVALKQRLEGIREYRKLEDKIRKLKNTYRQLVESPANADLSVSSTEDVSMKIDIYQSEQNDLEDKKKILLDLNLAVHRFLMDHKEFDSDTFNLKADIAELYRISMELYISKNDKLVKLNELLGFWRMLETRLDQLCSDLSDDRDMLGILDCAVEDGTFDQQMAVSARGVAKLLSETKIQNIPTMFANTNLALSSMMLDGGASMCGGSYSDSGISDEGSEHEPGERGRRIAALRRLAKKLEHFISPDSIAKIRMQERLQFVEHELRSLRSRCRSLMTKSGVAIDTPESSVRKPPARTAPAAKPGDPDDNPQPPYSWYRRIMRASFPFQLALVALVCLVFLLKPQCCDNMNTFNLSLQPHIHYTRGPPPT